MAQPIPVEKFEKVRYELADHIAVVTLNRPEVRNALDRQAYSELESAFHHIQADPEVRVAIVTGVDPAFCSGDDVRAIMLNAQKDSSMTDRMKREPATTPAAATILDCRKPVIAAVNGAASGLGADTALACDFVVASEHASFTWSYIHRGIVPDGGAMYFLPRRVGLAKAKELIFSGRKVDADEALALGIADRKASAATLVADAQAWAAELSKGSSTALALGKTILNQTFELTSHQVFAQGSQAQGICYSSAEHREAVMAFLAKSAPKA